jgi:hypothetical protein
MLTAKIAEQRRRRDYPGAAGAPQLINFIHRQSVDLSLTLADASSDPPMSYVRHENFV